MNKYLKGIGQYLGLISRYEVRPAIPQKTARKVTAVTRNVIQKSGVSETVGYLGTKQKSNTDRFVDKPEEQNVKELLGQIEILKKKNADLERTVQDLNQYKNLSAEKTGGETIYPQQPNQVESVPITTNPILPICESKSFTTEPNKQEIQILNNDTQPINLKQTSSDGNYTERHRNIEDYLSKNQIQAFLDLKYANSDDLEKLLKKIEKLFWSVKTKFLNYDKQKESAWIDNYLDVRQDFIFAPVYRIIYDTKSAVQLKLIEKIIDIKLNNQNNSKADYLYSRFIQERRVPRDPMTLRYNEESAGFLLDYLNKANDLPGFLNKRYDKDPFHNVFEVDELYKNYLLAKDGLVNSLEKR